MVLLRGINVGGKNKFAMTAFGAALEALGCSAVRTYIQSGNAVVKAPRAVAQNLARALSAHLEAEHALRIPVVVRSALEWRAALRASPFIAAGVDPDQVHVAFLADEPGLARAAQLDPARSPGDEFVLRGRELHLRLPNGVARSKLTNAYFDATLATTSTMRNWRTVQALAAMLDEA